MTSIYDFNEVETSGTELRLRDFRGQVLLIVNTASKCGLAPQLSGLEKLYQRYHTQGLVVIGLPSDQFHQELAEDEKVSEYCQLHYGVTFPMTKKVKVNGGDEDPLFTYLKATAGHGRIKWNYTKFLVDRAGKVIQRFAPITTPEKIEPAIVAALKKK
ncbi:MAG: glutathione peroxidase [Liquorilactobacillus nagelii]|jgi:glutathione peroxidase|uniref:glutathione peroxidase n=1 Tax=Liquorilactobacillus nagelii TaxID=82688 RepID=UPI00242B482E|nr:glutathione peroxidase [Liquorilactobacillus nagelii]MCI1921355.1 glutathione peroxidase [Liquorilactobacillus nagelii]MCI1977545.1 glutathione peroxidase [Liquorilactobacillus nagelii]